MIGTQPTEAPPGVISSTGLRSESIVWVRHNGMPHTSGIAHFGGECPPGWVGGARPFFSAEHLAAAVAADRERARLLELAEEGAKEAFGVVVQEKRDLEKEVRHLTDLLAGAHKTIWEHAHGKRLPNTTTEHRA